MFQIIQKLKPLQNNLDQWHMNRPWSLHSNIKLLQMIKEEEYDTTMEKVLKFAEASFLRLLPKIQHEV